MTDRKTASTINDTELDQLYDDLDHYEEHVVGDLNEKNIELACRAARTEAALDRIRALADRWDNALAPDRAYARALRAALTEPAAGPAATQTTNEEH